MVYTIFALDFNNKVLGDHLLVSRENLAAAIDELVAYWEAQQTEGDIHDQAVVGDTGKSTRVRCATARAGSLCRGSRVDRSSISLNRRSCDGCERDACDPSHRQNA